MKHKNNKPKNKFKFKTKYGGASPVASLPVATPIPVATPMAGGTDGNISVHVKPPPLGTIGKITKFITNIKSILLTIAALIAFLILLIVCYVLNKLCTSLFAMINYIIIALNAISKVLSQVGKFFGVKKKAKSITPIPRTIYDLVLKSIPPLPPIF